MTTLPALPQDDITRIFSEVASRAETTPAYVAIIQAAQGKNIRTMPEFDVRNEMVRAIKTICEIYAVELPSAEVMAVIMDTCRKSWANLSPIEFLTAFQMWGTGEVQVDAKFYGKFDLATFGKVVNSYIEQRRRKVQAELDRAATELARQNDAEKIEALNRKTLEDFPAQVDRYDRTSGWKGIPAIWYDFALRLGGIKWQPGEWKPIWEKAQVEARNELEEERNNWNKYLTITDEMVHSLAKTYAQKMAVWVKVMGQQI